MTEVTINILINFIREESGAGDTFIIDSSTTLENDLGITGDDGFELIRKLGKHFSVDVTQFKFDEYFYPEPNLLTTYKKIKPLTINHLYNGIINGILE